MKPTFNSMLWSLSQNNNRSQLAKLSLVYLLHTVSNQYCMNALKEPLIPTPPPPALPTNEVSHENAILSGVIVQHTGPHSVQLRLI